MVFKIEPLAKALSSILNLKSPAFAKASAGKQKSKTLVILFSASGKQFDSKMASDFVKKYDRIIMLAGHYEGVDERIFKVLSTIGHKPLAISVGPYVLTGGELPAMIVVDAVSRHISGVLGKTESLEEKRYGIGIPMYTRPEVFNYRDKKYPVPKVLLSGNHKKIDDWRKKHRK